MHTAGGTIIVPESSIARPEDVGKRARTFVRIFIPDGGLPINAANTPGGFFETPASLACVYQLVTAAKTCNPSTATTVSHGGAHAIALVDAYDDASSSSGVPTSPSRASRLECSDGRWTWTPERCGCSPVCPSRGDPSRAVARGCQGRRVGPQRFSEYIDVGDRLLPLVRGI